MASITASALSSLTATSIFVLGKKSTTYSEPLYNSVWPFEEIFITKVVGLFAFRIPLHL